MILLYHNQLVFAFGVTACLLAFSCLATVLAFKVKEWGELVGFYHQQRPSGSIQWDMRIDTTLIEESVARQGELLRSISLLLLPSPFSFGYHSTGGE